MLVNSLRGNRGEDCRGGNLRVSARRFRHGHARGDCRWGWRAAKARLSSGGVGEEVGADGRGLGYTTVGKSCEWSSEVDDGGCRRLFEQQAVTECSQARRHRRAMTVRAAEDGGEGGGFLPCGMLASPCSENIWWNSQTGAAFDLGVEVEERVQPSSAASNEPTVDLPEPMRARQHDAAGGAGRVEMGGEVEAWEAVVVAGGLCVHCLLS